MGFLRNVLVTAALGTVATTVTTLILGKRELGLPAAPLNATSHIAFGDEAAEQDTFSAKYTLTGGAINASAMLSWAVLQELVLGRWVRRGGAERALVAGVATSAVAYVTDYHVVPERLTPGFEKRFSAGALAVVYSALAVSLALGVGKARFFR